MFDRLKNLFSGANNVPGTQQETTPEQSIPQQTTPFKGFQGLQKTLTPKFSGTTMGELDPGVKVEEPKTPLKNRLLSPSEPIIRAENIQPKLQQAEEFLRTQYEKDLQGVQKTDLQGQELGWAQRKTLELPIRVGYETAITATRALQGLMQNIERASDGLGGILSGEPTAEDFGDVALGGLFGLLSIAFPGATMAFTKAGDTKAGEKVFETISNFGVDTMEEVSQYIPGWNELRPDQRKEIFDFGKFVALAMITRGAYKKLTSSKKLVRQQQEGAIDPAKYKEYSKKLDRKEGETLDQAFRRKAKTTHPDAPGGSTKAFQEVNEAYLSLKKGEFTEAWRSMTPAQKRTVGEMVKDVSIKIKERWNEPKKGQIDISAFKGEKGQPAKPTKKAIKKDIALRLKGESPNVDPSTLQAGVYKMQKRELNKELRTDYMTQKDRDFTRRIIKLSEKDSDKTEVEREKIIKDIQEEFNIDQFEAYDKFMEYQTASDKQFVEASAKQVGDRISDEIEAFYKDDVPPSHPKAIEMIEKYSDITKDRAMVYNKVDYRKLQDELVKQTYIDPTKKQGVDITDVLDFLDKQDAKKTIQRPVETKEPTTTKEPIKDTPKQKIPQETIDRLVGKYKAMVSKDLSKRISNKLVGEEKMSKILKKVADSIAYQPKITDVKQAYGDPRIIMEAIDFAKDRNVLDKAEYEAIKEFANKITSEVNKANQLVNPKGKPLTSSQKTAYLDMEDFKTPVKGVEDIKINIEPVNKFLKDNPDTKIHVIETPTIPEKKPFAMMGTKEKTYGQIMKPAVLKSIQEGSKAYIEPFGGVGTIYYHLPEYFQAGLQEAHINHFDVEKYVIIKAIKEGTMDVNRDLIDGYNTIIKDITDELLTNEQFNELYKTVNIFDDMMEAKVGSKEFREAIALLGFQPELAPRFFKEVLDGKLAKQGELTETFKERLADDIRTTLQEQDPTLEGVDLDKAVEQAVERTLSKPGLFEKEYASMSESVKRVLDRYDSDDYVTNIGEDHNKAILTAIARHFRQRGTSGQRMISPSDGFTSVEGVLDKMVETLGRYKKAFDMYGDRINIYSQDGKEFINERAGELSAKDMLEQSTWYLDPPYAHSNLMYLKNNPALKDALAGYSDRGKFKEIIAPAIGANNSLMFTNDINGEYFQALKDMLGNRMTDDIYTYKEGLTPTSFITTKNASIPMKDTNFMYYMTNSNAKIKNAMEFIDQLGGDIASKLKKNITKLISYFTPEMQKNMIALEKIRTGISKAEATAQQVEQAINTVTTGKEKQDMLRQLKEQARKGFLTGKPLIRLTDMLNKHIVNLAKEQSKVRHDLNKFKKSPSMDAQMKKEFFTAFDKEYTMERLTQEKQATSELKSVYSLDMDELTSLKKSLEVFKKLARDRRIKTEQQKEREITFVTEKAMKANEEGKVRHLESTRNQGEKTLLEGVTDWGMAYVDQYTSQADYLFHEDRQLGELKKEIDFSKIRSDRTISELSDPVFEQIAKYKMKGEDMKKINLYGYMMRGDQMGKIKVFAYLTKIGDPLKKIRTRDKMVNKMGRKSPVTEEKAKAMMETYSNDNFLNPKQQHIYRMMRDRFDKTWEMGAETMLREKNVLPKYIENYRPIVLDRKLNKADRKKEDIDMMDLQRSMKKTQAQQTLDKQTTTEETIPLMEAHMTFASHIISTTYYAKMQPVINKLNKVVERLGKKYFGNRGRNYLNDPETGYINRLANQGRIYIDSRGGKRMETLSANFAKAVLLGNPSAIAIQITNVFDAAMTGEATASLETARAYLRTNGKHAMRVLEQSQFLKNRHGHDKIKVIQETYTDIMRGNVKKVEVGLGKLLNAWDMFMGITLRDGVYRSQIKAGVKHKEAVYRADMVVKKAIGSFEVQDLPQSTYHLTGPRSALRQFQSFVINRFNLVKRRVVSGKGPGGKTYDDAGRRVTTSRYMYMLTLRYMANLSEAYIRYAIAKNIRGSEKERSRWNPIKEMYGSTLPYIGKLFGTDMYGNLTINLFEYGAIEALSKGASSLSKLPGKISDGDSIHKEIANIIAGVGAPFGMPGSITLARILKAFEPEESDRPTRTRPKNLDRPTERKRPNF